MVRTDARIATFDSKVDRESRIGFEKSVTAVHSNLRRLDACYAECAISRHTCMLNKRSSGNESHLCTLNKPWCMGRDFKNNRELRSRFKIDRVLRAYVRGI